MRVTARPKSREAQAERMREVWPGLKPLTVFADGRIAWIGPVRGFQMSYKLSVVWNPAKTIPPLVFVRQPTITPRPGTEWIDIPHLLYDPESPKDVDCHRELTRHFHRDLTHPVVMFFAL
jgi:hypothetical protein